MIQALIFLCIISTLAYFGYRMIRGPVVRFLFLLHSLGVFLMLGLPSLWHAYTEFSSIGFLGLVFDADQIEIAVTDLQILVVYVFSLTAVGFITISRLFSNRIGLIGNFSNSVSGPHYATMFVLFAICIVFFVSYYQDLSSILLFRSRENVVLPLYFELLRGTVVAACTYSTIVLATTKFISKPTGFMLTLSLFLFSLALMVGFGSRNLLVYPISSLIMIFVLNHDRSLFRRNVFLAGSMLIIFTTVSLFQSSFRDSGFAGGELTLHVEHLLLAFDQFDALYVAFETENDFTRPESRLPFSSIIDMFLFFVPRGLFEMVGLQKISYVNWLAWNGYLVGSINTNVTPSYVGQILIEEGISGIILLPFTLTIILLIVLKIMEVSAKHDKVTLNRLTMLALSGGLLFNIVRMVSGGYLLYFLVFAAITLLMNSATRLLVKVIRSNKAI